MQNPIKCLLIDDDTDDQDVFKMAVATLNIELQLIVVSSGDLAFEILNENILPDYIFLDLNMPKMNGREFLKKIKNIDRLMDIPVLIYSTSTSAKDRTDMLFLGAAQFITKPNSVTELSVILKKEFERHERRAS